MKAPSEAMKAARRSNMQKARATRKEKQKKSVEKIALIAGPGKEHRSRFAQAKRREADVARTGLTPLQYMLQVMRNGGNETPLRLAAAKEAATYIHPKLSSVQVRHSGTKDFSGMSIEQLQALEGLLLYVHEKSDEGSVVLPDVPPAPEEYEGGPVFEGELADE